MFKLEENVFGLGNWTSLDELEENLTMTELHRLFLAKQESDHNQRMFAASLKGVEMDPWVDPYSEASQQVRSNETIEERHERVKQQAAIRLAIANGELPEDYEYSSTGSSGLEGFGIESEDD